MINLCRSAYRSFAKVGALRQNPLFRIFLSTISMMHLSMATEHRASGISVRFSLTIWIPTNRQQCAAMSLPSVWAFRSLVMEPIGGGTLARLPRPVMRHFKAIDPNASAASWALRWCGSLPNVKVILSGMNERSQLVDNLATFKEFPPPLR